ncbi:MAG: bifunctional heptose 7-phosphate kinase/heptose 1-phosphate adenyltransferase, partial [Methyloprofundus sp.]|nr:bifunctional heptose 7-phosphate kinase/heptose 1-phosphate adenyltransferase [Methyloprofundus sp.]
MLDRFYHGNASRISPEAPVPVVNIDHIEDIPGGAANVAMNIAALGAQSVISGITGNDEGATTLQQRLNSVGVQCLFHHSESTETIIKQRVISNHQQLLRMDFESKFADDEWQGLKSIVEPKLAETSVIILSDYNKGTLVDPQYWIKLAQKHQIPVL